jgi:hypothetical protein
MGSATLAPVPHPRHCVCGALTNAKEGAARYLSRVTPRRSNPAESALSARVQPLANRAQRVASMLDRWEAEPLDDEPEWDVEELERLALRKPSDP